jgi:hypothetical protein
MDGMLFLSISLWNVKQTSMEFDPIPMYGNGDLRRGEKTIDKTHQSQEILKILVESKETGRAVGISSPLLGEGFFTTAVDDIVLLEGETIILLIPFDTTGFMLPVNKLKLSQVTAVCLFRSKFKNPILKNLNRGKNWFF